MAESRAIKETFGVATEDSGKTTLFGARRGTSTWNCFNQLTIKDIDAEAWTGSVFGVCTPGNDTPGMNSVIKAVYRIGSFLGCKIKYINHGFEGMVIGGDNFEDATFKSQMDIINKGGTILKSYKCPAFKERRSRLQAAENLIRAGVSKLICIGGDGTLRAMNLFFGEWIELLRELYDQKRITREDARAHKFLQVVNVICSVEADVMGTDLSIGQNSALHRIIDTIDAIQTTASSNNQAFVIEVLGENSGYLALATGISCQATMIFTPEWPPEGDWQKELYSKVIADSQKGDGIIIIVSEGATDRIGRPVRAQDVSDILSSQGIDTKVTILGQYQRGGQPTAFDIMYGLRAGAEAVVRLKQFGDDGPGMCAIGFTGNDIKVLDVQTCLDQQDAFLKMLKERRYVEAVRLKGFQFQSLLASYCIKSILKPAPILSIPVICDTVKRVGIMKIGQTTQGIAACMKICVEKLNYKGMIAIGIDNGFDGLVTGKLKELKQDVIKYWKLISGESIGSSDYLAEDVGFARIAKAIQKHNLSGLILMGSFEAFESLHQLQVANKDYPAFSIPMCMVPVTLINNIPGSDFTLGCDSAINETLEFCQKLKRVARGRANTVFVIETLGGNCGYLAFVCALCCAADNVYTAQEPLTLDVILNDCENLKHKIQKSGIRNGLIIRSDNANKNYSTDFIHKVMTEVGKGVFACCKATVGQVTLGCMPSSFDRIMGHQIGLRTGEWMSSMIEEHAQKDGSVFATNPITKAVLCCKRTIISFKAIKVLAAEADLEKKVPTYMWWKKLRPLMHIMAKNPEQSFQTEKVVREDDESEEIKVENDDPLWRQYTSRKTSGDT